MRTRTRTGLLVGVGALAAAAAGVVAVAPAIAHTPDLTCRNGTIVVNLTNYPAGSTVGGMIDGVNLGTTTFGPEPFHAEQAVDLTVEHTYSIGVVGSDGQGDQSWSGRTSELCGVPIVTPTEEPTGTPTPTPPVETPVPTDEPTAPPTTAPPTDEPTTPPTGEPSTPAPSDGPTSTPSPTVPATVPSPTGGTPTPSAAPVVPSPGVPSPGSHSTSPRSASSTASPVSVGDGTSADTLAYTGADGRQASALAILAVGLLAVGAIVLLLRRAHRRRVASGEED